MCNFICTFFFKVCSSLKILHATQVLAQYSGQVNYPLCQQGQLVGCTFKYQWPDLFLEILFGYEG